MLYTIAVVLIVVWLLGLVTSYTMGGFVHMLLVGRPDHDRGQLSSAVDVRHDVCPMAGAIAHRDPE